MEPTHPNLRGRKENPGFGRCQALGLARGMEGLARAKPIILWRPLEHVTLSLSWSVVDIYLGLILIESFPADDYFTAIRCPEVAGPCKIEVYLQALDSSLHTHRTIVTHHC